MSEQVLEIARAGYEAWNHGDLEWFEEHTTEDTEIVPAAGLFPDLEGTYHGIEGWRRFWEVFRAAWSSIDIEVQHLERLSDDDVFGLVRFDGVGRGSGVQASLTFIQWLSFRDGKLARLVVEMPDQKELDLDDPRG
ncbi:MAG: nuclear transport factor 2 family protein [Solirubrobacterales bacterium]